MNKFEKLFGNYVTQKLMQRYISDCYTNREKNLFDNFNRNLQNSEYLGN